MRFSLSIGAILAAVLLGSVSAAPAPTEFGSKVAQGLRLLSLEEGAAPIWKTEDEKLELLRSGANFVRQPYTPFCLRSVTDPADLVRRDRRLRAGPGSRGLQEGGRAFSQGYLCVFLLPCSKNLN